MSMLPDLALTEETKVLHAWSREDGENKQLGAMTPGLRILPAQLGIPSSERY